MKLAAFQISVTEEHERKGLGGKYLWELALLLCIRSQFTKSLPRLLSELRQLHCVGVGVGVGVCVCMCEEGEKERARERKNRHHVLSLQSTIRTIQACVTICHASAS